MKICLVTPDLVGPIKNGGIGTYSTNLARLLQEAGHQVTIIFTSVPEKNADPNWRNLYAARSIDLISFLDLPKPPAVTVNPHWEWFMERSWILYCWLKDRSFDVIHFQDWSANGFYSIQAKSTGQAFLTTHLCVTLHSPTQWCTQGMAEWPEDSFAHLRLNYCEKFCAEFADYTISPSQHMLDWAESEQWRFRNESLLLRNPFFKTVSGSEPASPDTSHVIFFGRLESRKGIRLFCEALNGYCRESKAPAIRKVTFIGKEMDVDGIPATQFIRNTIKSFDDIAVSVRKDFDTFEALEFIRQSGGIVIIPSLLDNFPYTLVECIVQGIPLWCSSGGGMKEICDPNKLFSPDLRGLKGVFYSLESDWLPSSHQYDPEIANRRMLEWHEKIASKPAKIQAYNPEPRLSIIISYFNHPEYLENALTCLLENELHGHEVLILNDGSTDSKANQVFRSLSRDPRFAGFKFINESRNRGLGGARNYLVSKASGDWLLFSDSDNCAMPTMVKDFSNAIVHSSADIITCHYQSFTGEFSEESKNKPYNYFRPYGDFTALGLFENVFGDANFAVRKQTFLQLGGFTEERNVYEDWNFLIKAVMNKKEILVIPKVTYWYRRSENSMVRTLNNYQSHLNVLEAYLHHADPLSRVLLRDIAIPLYHENYRLGKAWGKLNKKLQKFIMSQVPRTRVSRKPRKFWQFKFWK